MVVADNTFVSLLLHPKARPPLDPSTGKPLEHVEDRIELLIERLETDGETIIIPVPVLSEFLILADTDGPKYLADITSNHLFLLASFDPKAAIELAAMSLSIRRKTGTRRGDQGGTWAKITFDRQIVAIAKVNNASVIYSDDEDVERLAKQHGISVVRTWELPLPKAKQSAFPFEPSPMPVTVPVRKKSRSKR